VSQRKGTEEEIKGIESGKCLKIENADSRNWDLDIAGIVQCFLSSSLERPKRVKGAIGKLSWKGVYKCPFPVPARRPVTQLPVG
jgi:hypothetical protein